MAEKQQKQGKCSDTYGDLLSLMRLQDPDPTTLLTNVLHTNLGLSFLKLAIAHVKNRYVIPLLHCNATVAGHRVVSAATVPLARMDLKPPAKAFIQNECTSLVVLITPGDSRKGHVFNRVHLFLRTPTLKYSLPAIKCDDMWISQRVTHGGGNVFDHNLKEEKI